MIKIEIPDVLVPCAALGFTVLRLDDQERWIAFAWENGDVVSLHRPIVGEIKDVVGCADDHGGEIMLLHHPANTAPFVLVERKCHWHSPEALRNRRKPSVSVPTILLSPESSCRGLC